ncbi:tyrosine-type recombinase/integrase [Streptomyces sp. NPDC051567]|uniref:tyrosine-type recombinase/integrase n=1 Tax=Streptomyces sp. NPDC051567 TaxID=3365660 RepID=UPI00379C0666
METGRVFTRENGELLHPANVTRRFIELYEEIGLPPIRFHDLRHGAATLARAAGADLKDIQEMLGHSSITITADTYTSLFPEADLAIAEAAARLVPRARPITESQPQPDAAEEPGPESVPDDADPLGEIREINSPSAHANGPGRRVRGRIEPLPGGETPGQSGNALCPRQDSNLRHRL